MRALVLLVLVLQAAPLAAAHAEALRTFPAPGASLDQAPAVAWVELSETPDPRTTTLRLVDGQGRDVPLGPLAIDAARVTAPLPPLGPGGYVAKWSTVDAVDGHVVRGSWAFALGGAAAPAPAPAEATPVAWDVVAGKAVAFVGLALAAGGVATRSLAGPRLFAFARVARLERAGGALLVAGSVLLLAGHARASGLPAAEALLGTVHGRVLLARLALAAAAAAWLWRAARPRAWERRVDEGLLAAYVLAVAATSHAAGAMGLAGLAADALHLASIAAWTGGLVGLALVLRDDAHAEDVAAASRRFSALATACVVTMAATGAALLVGIVGLDPAHALALLGTPYGLLLLAMIVLGVAMAALGAVSRFVHLARLLRGSALKARRPFRRHLGREASVGVALLLVAAGLTNLPPLVQGEALALTATPPTSASGVMDACAAREDAVACYVDVLMALQAERGPGPAFDVLADMAENASVGVEVAHAIAHDLGRDALQNFGSVQATLSNCSERVFQGCIHGALQAYFDDIDEVRPEHVAHACDLEGPNATKNAVRNCIHGIGHGVLVRTGYDVAASLALCDALPDEPDQRDCYQGIFMENMDSYVANRTGVSRESAVGHEHDHHGEGHGYADPANPAAPCDALPARYQMSCWTYQPALLLHFNGGSLRGAMTQCHSLPGEANLSRACFGGLGGMIAFGAGNDPLRAMRDCGLAPSFVGQGHCVRGFIGTLVAGGGDVEPGLATCQAAQAVDKEACFEGLGLGASRLIPHDDVPVLCARAGEHEDDCLRGAGLA